MKTKNIFFSTMLVVLFLFLGSSAASAQLGSGCSGGLTGCAGCNATVKRVTLDFKFGDRYYFSSGVSVCGDACSVSSYIWTVNNAQSYNILMQGSGFAQIQITSLPGCGVTAPAPQVCLQVVATPVGGGTPCPPSAPLCITVPCN
jgi:hypothetical protein